MGLQHQSSWSGGTKTAEYQSGPGDGTAPTMGNSYGASRSMWWYGLNTNDVYQNDMQVISANPFGYAAFTRDWYGSAGAVTSFSNVSRNKYLFFRLLKRCSNSSR